MNVDGVEQKTKSWALAQVSGLEHIDDLTQKISQLLIGRSTY